MNKYIYDDKNGLWYECDMNCKEIIISLVLSYQPKKNSLSVCGDSDTNTTYRNINGRFIFRCSQAAN